MGRNSVATSKSAGDDLHDLWNEDNGTKAVTKPQPIVIPEKKWTISPDLLPDTSATPGPRLRKEPAAKPNKRAAVTLPRSGQSYLPDEGERQAVVAEAVNQLTRRKERHERFVKRLTDTSAAHIKRGTSLVNDKMWEEEEVKDAAALKRGTPAGRKARKAKKIKAVTMKEIRRSEKHRRHPDRDAVVKEADEVALIAKEVNKKVNKSKTRAAARKLEKKLGQKIESFGRYHYTPTVVDVASSDKLIGSLRHLDGAVASHPALDRMKSLEERNLVPARMRHTYNRRKQLKPKGEVMIKKEKSGMLPDKDDHSLPPKN